MERYLALLRGINVGGNNIIKMSELRDLFQNCGFSSVSSYINSGNILFSAANVDKAQIQKQCQNALLQHFSLNIPTYITNKEQLTSALAAAPSWWGTDPNSKHNALFLIPPLKSTDVCDFIASSEYEQHYCYDDVVFWSAPLATFFKTKLTKIHSSNMIDLITIRNVNTSRKLGQLINQL